MFAFHRQNLCHC